MVFQLNEPPSAARMTAHEWVLERLRRGILTGELLPGARLVQTEIAEALGVSVTPVREAMRDLVNEGLIRLDPHKAAQVRDLDIEEAIEIYDLRQLLEPEAVRKATPLLTDAQIDELAWLQNAMEGDVESGTWLELNHRWHLLVSDAAASPRLSEILGSLRRVSRFYHAASLRAGNVDRSRSHAEHHAMIAAFRAGDAETATRIMAGHLPSSAELRRRFSVDEESIGVSPA